MTSALRSAEAILVSARLNIMGREYAAALSSASTGAMAYNDNPLRHKTALLAQAITDARSVGAGMCEFEAVTQAGCRHARLRCIAPASIAIHIRIADTIKIIGTSVKRGRASFFSIEDIRSPRS